MVDREISKDLKIDYMGDPVSVPYQEGIEMPSPVIQDVPDYQEEQRPLH